jgi:hypothetical protein
MDKQDEKNSDSPVITPAEFAKKFELSLSATYEGIRRKDIQTVRVGRKIFIPKRWIESWLIGDSRG